MNSETSSNQSGIKIHSTEDRKDKNVNPKNSTFQYINYIRVDILTCTAVHMFIYIDEQMCQLCLFVFLDEVKIYKIFSLSVRGLVNTHTPL